jgi:hypothetical protein
MPRKKTTEIAPPPAAPINGELIQADQSKMAERLGQLATRIGYQGDLSLTALWDQVHFQQRRSAEAVLEMGKALLLIKEQSPHGEFAARLGESSIHPRMAQRFMAAALKFGKSDAVSLLRAAATQAKVLELTVLDDEEVAALERDGALGAITLDKLECMSATQLRAEIRKLRNKIDQDGERASNREAEIDRLSSELAEARRAIKRRTPDQQAQAMLLELTQHFIGLRTQAQQLADGTGQLLEHGQSHGEDYRGDVASRATDLANVVIDLLNQLRTAGITDPWKHVAELVKEG